MQFSPDGQWFWDGVQWRPAYSPDRAWRWDGRQWVPTGSPAVQRWRYEPTDWTPRLQVMVLALTALGVLSAVVSVPVVMVPMMRQSIDRSLAVQSSAANVDLEQMRSFMNGVVYMSVGFGVVVGVVIVAIIVIGTVKLWRWMYWFLAVTYLLALLAVPQSVIYALGVGPLSLPAWWPIYSIPVALVEAALGVWMIVLSQRYGTWARRRVPA